MRRLMFSVVAVGVLFSAGSSYAQEDSAQMPEKVRAFLDSFEGNWNFEGSSMGMAEMSWDSGKNAIVSNVQFEKKGLPGSCLAMWYWDGISEDGIMGSWALSNKEGFSQIRQEWKVLSKKSCEGPRAGVLYGKELTARSRIEFTGPDRFTWSLTDFVLGGEKQPDTTDVFTRIKPTAREDQTEWEDQEWAKLIGVWRARGINGASYRIKRITRGQEVLENYSSDGEILNPGGLKSSMKIERHQGLNFFTVRDYTSIYKVHDGKWYEQRRGIFADDEMNLTPDTFIIYERIEE